MSELPFIFRSVTLRPGIYIPFDRVVLGSSVLWIVCTGLSKCHGHGTDVSHGMGGCEGGGEGVAVCG